MNHTTVLLLSGFVDCECYLVVDDLTMLHIWMKKCVMAQTWGLSCMTVLHIFELIEVKTATEMVHIKKKQPCMLLQRLFSS